MRLIQKCCFSDQRGILEKRKRQRTEYYFIYLLYDFTLPCYMQYIAYRQFQHSYESALNQYIIKCLSHYLSYLRMQYIAYNKEFLYNKHKR